MPKMRRGLKVFLASFLVCCFVIVVLVSMYFVGSFPEFNSLVDNVIGVSRKDGGDAPTVEQDGMVVDASDGIRGLQPHLLFVPDTDVAALLQGFGGDAPSSEVLLSEDSCSITHLDAGWTYEGLYPVVAPPAVFVDAVAFVDAEPAFICLDKETGTVLMRIPCQVYPGMESFSQGQSYYFKSRLGDWYEVAFSPGSVEPEFLLPGMEGEVNMDFEQELRYMLRPSESACDFIAAKMNSILSVSPAVSIQEIALYDPEEQPVSFAEGVISPAFVFSPAEQGTYTLGLCDETGAWIRSNAFVVLYTLAGETLAVSLDYVADRPQITTHLSDQELYVACIGFIPDSLLLDAAPSSDFRIVQEGTSVVEEEDGGAEVSLPPVDTSHLSWFQVKRTP